MLHIQKMSDLNQNFKTFQNMSTLQIALQKPKKR